MAARGLKRAEPTRQRHGTSEDIFNLLAIRGPTHGEGRLGIEPGLPEVSALFRFDPKTLSNLPSPRNPKCAGITAGLHGVPQLFLYPQVENAQEVPNDSKQMYSCAETKINSREPSWMV